MMQQLQKTLNDLSHGVTEAYKKLDIESLAKERDSLADDMAQPDFWQDTAIAQTKSKRFAAINEQIKPWEELRLSIDELHELIELNDISLRSEIETQLSEQQSVFDKLKGQLRFNGRYDRHDVILSIYAGAGGTDAQDWAEILLRMYMRWAERQNVKTTLLTESRGDEAGIKSASIELIGSFVYGRLKGEQGVHRLVRQSPFNSDNLRQTSFAMVEVIPKIAEPKEVAIDEKDLKIDVYRSGGKGGQSVNTTDSAVRITHVPTGISVAIQNERSQIQNRETAMTILRSKLAQLQLEQHTETLDQLKGPNTSAEWGNQIRNYVLHPYKQVKDVRTKHESSDPEAVLNGDIDDFIEAYLEYIISSKL